MENNLFDSVFRNSDGEIIIAQKPNLELILWFVSSLLGLLFASGKPNLGLEAIAFGSLFTWAWKELFEGVNYFRKALGFCILIGLIASKTLAVPY
ncbi:MAG: hypothetical protein HC851_02495 [Acaryochloris sp. RU_4_1]|nr:hypothetical protein [Acaryochloris sp. RU_4_1]NJR55708.1 hypothetical protein [Acaryochloris sp. CRU_2_0]